MLAAEGVALAGGGGGDGGGGGGGGGVVWCVMMLLCFACWLLVAGYWLVQWGCLFRPPVSLVCDGVSSASLKRRESTSEIRFSRYRVRDEGVQRAEGRGQRSGQVDMDSSLESLTIEFSSKTITPPWSACSRSIDDGLGDAFGARRTLGRGCVALVPRLCTYGYTPT